MSVTQSGCITSPTHRKKSFCRRINRRDFMKSNKDQNIARKCCDGRKRFKAEKN